MGEGRFLPLPLIYTSSQILKELRERLVQGEFLLQFYCTCLMQAFFESKNRHKIHLDTVKGM